MNQILRYLKLFALLIPILFSCQKEVPEPVAVTSVSLNAESAELTEGEEIQLEATVYPNNAENKTVIWSSSNISIASVVDGKVTALKAGKATISVKTEDGGKIASCEITVNAKVYPATSVSLDKTSAELTEGDELTLTATVNPDNATNKNVRWTSNNTNAATVNNGKVIALEAGKATITATTEDGGHTATCQLIIKAKYYPVTGLSLDKTSIEVVEGDEVTLNATVTPDNATNKNVTWKSSNTATAVIDGNGKITAVKPGKATITATSEDSGQTATCEVTVKERIYPVEGISLNKTTASLLVGDEMTLEATIQPANATNKNIEWSSSNPTVVSVVNGRIKALQLGSATITVTTEDGSKTASCAISVVNIDSLVKASFNSISVGSGSMSFEGSYVKLTAGVKMGVSIYNNSAQTITLTGFSLICGKRGSTIKYSISETNIPKENGIRYTITLNSTIYAPIAEFTYRYGSETYKARVQYNGSF